MSTRDFIQNVVNGKRVKAGSCASVYFDGKHIYSYGLHYPLLINVRGKWLVNTAGYSATTAKHISYAKWVADYIIELPNSGMTIALLPDELLRVASYNLKGEFSALSKLTKRAFRKIAHHQERAIEFAKTAEFLQNMVDELVR